MIHTALKGSFLQLLSTLRTAQERIENLSKTLRQRQRERHKTNGLTSRTMAVQSLCISLPFSAKQLREKTKLCEKKRHFLVGVVPASLPSLLKLPIIILKYSDDDQCTLGICVVCELCLTL